MKSRASKTIYWPGINNHIENMIGRCNSCSYNASSHSKKPLILTSPPNWSFQIICGNYFELKGHYHLTIADRFSGWICIYHFPNGSATSSNLIIQCRTLFMNYGAPDEFSSDGGPQFISTVSTEFLQTWGIARCLSSVSYPQSNCRTEAAVKTANCIIQDNTASNGSLNTDRVAKAIMQYCNTPLPAMSLSPAKILFHRTLCDLTPAHSKHYELHKDWILSANQQEMIVTQQKTKMSQAYDQTAHPLKPLSIGKTVLIQNTSNNLQHSKNGTKVVQWQWYNLTF